MPRASPNQFVSDAISLLKLSSNEELVEVRKWVENELIDRIGREKEPENETARGIPAD